MSAKLAAGLLGEIESPRPLRAPGGEFTLSGWCLADGEAALPEIRVCVSSLHLPATRTPRSDLAATLPRQPAATHAGFAVSGHLPAGMHVARIEARQPDGDWQCFRQFTVSAEAPPFRGTLDSPISRGLLTDRVKVGGWAADPSKKIARLVLRYGHREIACRTDLTRKDIVARADGTPATTQSGFESEDFLVAGHGPVRLKAWLDDGTVRIVRTPVVFSITEDETHPRSLELTAARIGLGAGSKHAVPEPGTRQPRPRNILFVLPGSFASNNALHAAALANELAAAGHRCAVAVSHDLATLAHHERPAFQGLLHTDASNLTFADGRGPDIIHSWTTRENVRRLSEQLRARHNSRLIVHLEDNEQQLLSLTLGRPWAELAAMPDAALDRLVPADLSHPHRSRSFLADADGITLITERLREFVPAGKPCHILRPAADSRYFYPRPRPEAFHRMLDALPGTTVLFYHGNVHASNAAEVRELYAAVLGLNRTGTPVTLIRTGLDTVDFLGNLAAATANHVLSLGQLLHHRHLPPLMALADVFVQPGQPDAFNDYRFPSKLPEFFALGRPVVLPRTNLGEVVRHGIDAYVLDRADAAGITQAIRELRADPVLAERLARGAIAFSEKTFSWRSSAEALAKFYGTLAAS